jgi:isopentenyl-diphosphate Delta-isomerase
MGRGELSDDGEMVVLVDEADREMGLDSKLDAHVTGALHRAFSVFVLNAQGELLLQRRAAGKYHSPGLWANTCCGHPRPGEAVAVAARRRLHEEMGFDCTLEPAGALIYRAEVGGGLVEHEYDHLFTGRHDLDPLPDPVEVSEWRWQSHESLLADVEASPEQFAPWLEPALRRVIARD